jgi:plasmid replication initiation protein
VATRRETSGDAYRRLCDAFERLAGTRITTNITTGDTEATTGFGLIDSWKIVRKTRDGRMVSVVVTLSEWLFRAVMARSVLTLNRDYFTLRRPMERRLYELARKHCGRQAEWRITVDTLLKKSGSASPRRVFRAMLRDIIAKGNIPDYDLVLEADDVLRVTPKVVVSGAVAGAPLLGSAALDAARALAPGWDVHGLEAEWKAYWVRSGRRPLRAPEAAFLGWVRRRVAG